MVRGFIESVLRYGLPLDFLPVFVEPNMKREKALKVSVVADAITPPPPRPAIVVDASRHPPVSTLSVCVCVIHCRGR